MERKCSNCQCWQRDAADGICRAKCPEPKVMPANESGFAIVWPRTGPDEFCFECFIPVKE